jgi:hypothetical protein
MRVLGETRRETCRVRGEAEMNWFDMLAIDKKVSGDFRGRHDIH